MYQTCTTHAPIPCKVWDAEWHSIGEEAEHDTERDTTHATDPDQEADHP